MKSMKNFLGIVAIIAVIGFMTLPLTGCPEDGGGSGGGGGGGGTVVPSGVSMADAIPLTENVWADGNISTSDGEQWFKFTATAEAQYIYFAPGTLSTVTVQLYYNETGGTIDGSTSLSVSSPRTSRIILSGNVYYIKVTPGSSASGTYKITFSKSSTAPAILPTENVTTLTEGEWADGSISANGEQWFKFTATANPQYIHFVSRTFYVYVQLYDATGTATGNTSTLGMGSLLLSRPVTNDSVYYIKVTPYNSSSNGAYKIAFTASNAPPSVTLPTENVTTLTEGAWADGSISANDGEQWFKFTATANTQYIHFDLGTLSSVYIQLYDNTGTATGPTSVNSTIYISQAVTNNNEYYINVKPRPGSYSGGYKIGFTTSTTPPPSTITLPTEDVTKLTEGVWTYGSISADGGEQWFKFTATASTQHILFITGTSPSGILVRLYDDSGTTTGAISGINVSDARTITSGSVYYIKVYGIAGSYRITFGKSNALPPIDLPTTENVTELTEGAWADGSISTNGEQWFKFTATASTQYIHFAPGALNDIYVQLYDETSTPTGDRTNLYGSNLNTSKTVTNSSMYYINVSPYYSNRSGAYKIAFNTSSTAPAP